MSEIKELKSETTEESAVLLALETAIEGGSFALFEGGRLTGGWVGGGEVSKSEDVLSELKKFLEKNRIKTERIKYIAASNGPGSFTGIRIGAATVFGLRKALGCTVAAMSVFEAMTSIDAADRTDSEKSSAGRRTKILCAVPFGKNQICRRRLIYEPDGRIKFEKETGVVENRETFFEEFASKAKYKDFSKIILHASLYKTINEAFDMNDTNDTNHFFDGHSAACGKVVDAGLNMAELIGKRAIDTAENRDGDTKALIPDYVGSKR